MIRSALIAFGLSAGAAQGQALVPTASLLETCGGTRLVLSASADDHNETRMNDEFAQATEVIDTRIGAYLGARYDPFFASAFSYAELQESFANDQDRKISVSLPTGMGIPITEVLPLFERVDFAFLDVERQVDTNAAINVEPTQIVLQDAVSPEFSFVLTETPVLDGYAVSNALVIMDQSGQPAVAFSLTQAGAATFGDYTSNNIGSPFAIVVNGKVMSAPVIQSAILGGDGMITGAYTTQEAEELAAILHGGVLPFDLDVVFQDTMDGSDPSADFCP